MSKGKAIELTFTPPKAGEVEFFATPTRDEYKDDAAYSRYFLLRAASRIRQGRNVYAEPPAKVAIVEGDSNRYESTASHPAKRFLEEYRCSCEGLTLAQDMELQRLVQTGSSAHMSEPLRSNTVAALKASAKRFKENPAIFRRERSKYALLAEQLPANMSRDQKIAALSAQHGASRKTIERAFDEYARIVRVPKSTKAGEWLHQLLTSGPVRKSEVRTKAAAAGYAWGTVEKAAKAIGIVSTGKPAVWQLAIA